MSTIKRAFMWVFGVTIGLFLVQGCIGKKQGEPFNLELLNEKDNIITVAILGNGPAGLSAAGYAARAGWQTVVFQGPKPGGLLTETTWVENWPGNIKILGQDIINQLESWARDQFGVSIVADTIDNVDLSQWPYKLHTENGHTIYALSVIIATGAAPEQLMIPGESEYWSSGVSACAVCDAPFFKNKAVVVIGGGDSAAEEAMQLAQHARQVTILVRKDAMRASSHMQKRLKEHSNIAIMYNREVTKIIGDGTIVTHIEILNNKDNKAEQMPIDGVFLAIGHKPNSQLFEGKLSIDARGYILTEGKTQKTSVAGVFAAGDVEDSIYRQVITAQGKGVQAALDADRFLREIGFKYDQAQQLQEHFFMPDPTQKSIVLGVSSLTELEHYFSEQSGLVIVDFYAQYCPSCLQMMPVVNAVAHEFESKAVFLKVDIDAAEDIVKKYTVPKVPYLIIFKDGQQVASYNKILDKNELREAVSEFIDTGA